MKDYYRQGKEIEPLENTKCRFCGCDNKGKYKVINLKYANDRFYVDCDCCGAQTKLYKWSKKAIKKW